MTDTNKVNAYKAWKAGQSKASLALEYEVSPRTIGRWIEEVDQIPPTVVLDKSVQFDPVEKDTRYLKAYEYKNNSYDVTNAYLAEYFEVSESTIRRWLKKATDETFTKVEENFDHEVMKIVPINPFYKYVASSKSISITEIDSNGLTNTVSSDKNVDGFADILDGLIATNFSQEALANAYHVLQPAKLLELFTQGKVQVDVAKKQIFYIADEDTVPYLVHNTLTDRVIAMLRAGETGVQTLLNFLEKLLENPSRRAVDELYGFLIANDIEIAEDGDFLAWKKVSHDYLDIYTGTMDNSPGKSPRVARNMVDENSEVTCSYGLHVCSKSYLPHFGNSSSSRVVRVKVNPADVVAIPKDYNNAKMRCAGYEVLEDVTDLFYSL